MVQCLTGEEGVWEFNGCLVSLLLILVHLDDFFLSFQIHVYFYTFLSHLSNHPLQLFYGSSASCLFGDEILLHGLEFGQEILAISCSIRELNVSAISVATISYRWN